MRRRFTPRDRKHLLGLYEKSGQSAVTFCRENDLSPSSLWRWLTRSRGSGREDTNAGGLVEIPILALRKPDMHTAAVRCGACRRVEARDCRRHRPRMARCAGAGADATPAKPAAAACRPPRIYWLQSA